MAKSACAGTISTYATVVLWYEGYSTGVLEGLEGGKRGGGGGGGHVFPVHKYLCGRVEFKFLIGGLGVLGWGTDIGIY